RTFYRVEKAGQKARRSPDKRDGEDESTWRVRVLSGYIGENRRMDFEPHSYQLDLIEHFVEHKRCAGWASLGSGKTVSTLTAIDRMHLMGLTAPVLILAPKLVANITWPDEAKKWSHLSGMTIQPIGGTEKQKIKALNTDAQV